MCMQAKPPRSIHLARDISSGVLSDLSRSAQVHHSRSLAAGDFVRLQKLANCTGRWRVLRLRFRLPHAVGDTRNINLTASSVDSINLVPDGGRVHGAQKYPANGLASLIAANGTNLFHDFLQKKCPPKRAGAAIRQRNM